MHRIEQPCLIVVGQHDELTPACALRMHQVLPNAEIARLQEQLAHAVLRGARALLRGAFRLSAPAGGRRRLITAARNLRRRGVAENAPLPLRPLPPAAADPGAAGHQPRHLRPGPPDPGRSGAHPSGRARHQGGDRRDPSPVRARSADPRAVSSTSSTICRRASSAARSSTGRRCCRWSPTGSRRPPSCSPTPCCSRSCSRACSRASPRRAARRRGRPGDPAVLDHRARSAGLLARHRADHAVQHPARLVPGLGLWRGLPRPSAAPVPAGADPRGWRCRRC